MPNCKFSEDAGVLPGVKQQHEASLRNVIDGRLTPQPGHSLSGKHGAEPLKRSADEDINRCELITRSELSCHSTRIYALAVNDKVLTTRPA